MASCSKTTMPSSEDVDVRPLYCLRCGAAWQLCKWALFSTFYDPSCWRAPPALVRRTATLLASVTTDTFTIFHYFFLCFSFKQREWTNHVWNQMVKICSRLGWHASSPIDNAANSADMAAELSWPQQWALRYTQNGIAAHHLPSPPKIKRTRTCWTVQTRVDVSYTECRGSILFVSWPRKNATCNMFLWPRLCLNAF